jgi:Uma2 family endonuclease
MSVQLPLATEKTQPAPRRRARSAVPPPLTAGDRLTRPEFERIYQAHPEIKKAELIEGIVYMPTPVHFAQHGLPHSDVMTWLGVYRATTPGVLVGDNVTVRLDYENVVQPDAIVRLDPEYGGRSRVSKDDYLEGPPELIVEIAASSAAYDLHDKRRVYARNGVQEYLAAQMYEQKADWFVLREGVYETLRPDVGRVLRSEIFPGLWLNPAALFNGDLVALLAVLQQGLASPEHAAFVERLHGV